MLDIPMIFNKFTLLIPAPDLESNLLLCDRCNILFNASQRSCWQDTCFEFSAECMEHREWGFLIAVLLFLIIVHGISIVLDAGPPMNQGQVSKFLRWNWLSPYTITSLVWVFKGRFLFVGREAFNLGNKGKSDFGKWIYEIHTHFLELLALTLALR